MLLDLTRPFSEDADRFTLKTGEIFLPSEWCDYTGVVYDLACNSMCGTYIDFPGHIKECDDGTAADNVPLEKLLRQEAVVLHLGRVSGDGAVTADDLTAAAGGTCPKCPCLVVNALKEGLNPCDIESRSVWFDRSAVDWIIATGCHLLVSDIYERREILGVFKILFDAGVWTVCNMQGLYRLPSKALISAVCLPVAGMTQIHCRLFAEI